METLHLIRPPTSCLPEKKRKKKIRDASAAKRPLRGGVTACSASFFRSGGWVVAGGDRNPTATTPRRWAEGGRRPMDGGRHQRRHWPLMGGAGPEQRRCAAPRGCRGRGLGPWSSIRTQSIIQSRDGRIEALNRRLSKRSDVLEEQQVRFKLGATLCNKRNILQRFFFCCSTKKKRRTSV